MHAQQKFSHKIGGKEICSVDTNGCILLWPKLHVGSEKKKWVQYAKMQLAAIRQHLFCGLQIQSTIGFLPQNCLLFIALNILSKLSHIVQVSITNMYDNQQTCIESVMGVASVCVVLSMGLNPGTNIHSGMRTQPQRPFWRNRPSFRCIPLSEEKEIRAV